MAEAKQPNVETDSVVSDECIHELLEFFSRSSYKARSADRRNEIIHKTCIHLIARDYEVEVIDNKSGQLCGHYPSELIVIEGHKTTSVGQRSRRVNNTAQLKELISGARYARCRSRFVMPVLLFEDKNICRSATLSTMAEMYGRAGMDWIFTGETSGSAGKDRGTTRVASPALAWSTAAASGDSDETELMTRVRGQDVQLLKAVRVDLICDLMVEKKKSKYGLSVASSEKVDKWARYSDFQIASMPYPGCEFFKDYKENGFNPVNLHFDWSQSMIDADLLIPDTLARLTRIDFKTYQNWDLVQITLNYLKLFLSYIQHGNGSLLIHCISGWDRTPLFICLLRLSLWADNRAHSSLSPREILYFTLAYDWFAFGHPFKDRHEKGEAIMYFCFDFLKYMTSDELAVHRTPQHRRQDKSQHLCEYSHSLSTSDSGSTLFHPLTSSSRDHHSSTELGESWVVESSQSNGPLSESWHYVSSSHVNSAPSSQHSSLQHLLSLSSRPYVHDSLSSVPEEHSHSSSSHPHSLPLSTRREKLLAVQMLFKKAYRTAVPEVPQSPMSFATGLFSRLTASFGSSNSDTQV